MRSSNIHQLLDRFLFLENVSGSLDKIKQPLTKIVLCRLI